MATSSERVPVKLKIGEVKYRGVIVRTVVDTAAVEVTFGGLLPGGPPPDQYRSWAPGMHSQTLIVNVGEYVPPTFPATVKLKIAGVKSRGVVTGMAFRSDISTTTLTIEIVS